LFHADETTDGQTEKHTDMTELVVAFRNFANAPKKCAFCPHRTDVFCVYFSTNSDICPT